MAWLISCHAVFSRGRAAYCLLLGANWERCGGGRYYGLKPDIKVISPWREWDLNSRSKLIEYAEANGIEVPSHKRGEPPFSMDANLLHISYEGCAPACWLICD